MDSRFARSRRSLLEPLASAINGVMSTMLECHGGVLSLAADPAAAKLLHQLLEAHGTAPAAQGGEAKPLEGGEGAGADAPPTWAAGLSQRVRDSCRAVLVRSS